MSITELAALLEMNPHPEGGFYKETYRSTALIPDNTLPDFPDERNCCTGIYFLIGGQQFSAFHRILSDELWHFYSGNALNVHVIDPDGNYTLLKVGNDFAAGYLPQAVVKAGSWFASECAAPDGWSLVGCTVSPGFDFADFELAKRAALASAYPQHEALISRLCRE